MEKEQIEKQAREMGISEARIKEGFAVPENASDEEVRFHLTMVKGNESSLGMPTKAEFDKMAENLIR